MPRSTKAPLKQSTSRIDVRPCGHGQPGCGPIGKDTGQRTAAFRDLHVSGMATFARFCGGCGEIVCLNHEKRIDGKAMCRKCQSDAIKAGKHLAAPPTTGDSDDPLARCHCGHAGRPHATQTKCPTWGIPRTSASAATKKVVALKPKTKKKVTKTNASRKRAA